MELTLKGMLGVVAAFVLPFGGLYLLNEYGGRGWTETSGRKVDLGEKEVQEYITNAVPPKLRLLFDLNYNDGATRFNFTLKDKNSGDDSDTQNIHYRLWATKEYKQGAGFISTNDARRIRAAVDKFLLDYTVRTNQLSETNTAVKVKD